MNKLCISLILIILSGCTTVEKASSIEDYCNSVSLESKTYREKLDKGAQVSDLRAYIIFSLSGYFPQKEIFKMLDVVDMVSNGDSPEVIYNRCVQQRNDNTWFRIK